MLRALKRLISRWIKSPAAVGAKLAKKIDWRGAEPGRITVLCLDRSQFIKDIEELRRLTDINWVTLNAVKVKSQQERWVPAADRHQGYFSGWLKEDRARHLRPVLEKFGVALLTEAQRHMRIDAVAAANMDYWQDEALKLGCRRLNIPFLVLCRENYTIPWTVPWHHDYIAKTKFHFDGAGIAVFSEPTKGAITPAVSDPDDIWVTGAPRYDRWLNLTPSDDAGKTHLSLITFNDPGYQATETFLEVIEIFSKVAEAERREG
jgi:hypothetical protein